MEISTSPHRPAPTPWGRLLVGLVVLGPVMVLVLLPIGLGLQRYVMSGDSMNGGIDQGSVVFERSVPVSDLRVGDVITYRAPDPDSDGRMVTHRIVDIGRDGIRTQGDANPAADPWTLRPDGPTVSRVVFAVPWVGYAYLLLVHPHVWLLLPIALAGVGTLVLSEVRRRKRAGATGRAAREPVASSTGLDRTRPSPEGSTSADH